jgi:hypothetical protein
MDRLVEVGYARHQALATLATCQAPGQVLTQASRPQPGQCVHPATAAAVDSASSIAKVTPQCAGSAESPAAIGR